MTDKGEYDDDDFEDPPLFRYVTGEELLAELESAEAERAAASRAAELLPRTSFLMLAASVLAALSAISFASCASTAAVSPGPLPDVRGTVVMHGRSVKALVVGPTVVHAFTTTDGGMFYAAPAVTGADQDCVVAPASPAQPRLPIAARRPIAFRIDAGQLACLAAPDAPRFKLSWHEHEERVSHDSEIRVAVAPRARP